MENARELNLPLALFMVLTARHSTSQQEAPGGCGELGNAPSNWIKLQNHLWRCRSSALSSQGTADARTDRNPLHAADPWHLSLLEPPGSPHESASAVTIPVPTKTPAENTAGAAAFQQS